MVEEKQLNENQETFNESLYETFCEVASLGKEICTEDFFEQLKLKNFDLVRINFFKDSSSRLISIEKNLSEFYPEKDINQIKEDCSKIILGDKKDREVIYIKLKEVYNLIKKEMTKAFPSNMISRTDQQEMFLRFYNRVKIIVRVLIEEFKESGE